MVLLRHQAYGAQGKTVTPTTMPLFQRSIHLVGWAWCPGARLRSSPPAGRHYNGIYLTYVKGNATCRQRLLPAMRSHLCGAHTTSVSAALPSRSRRRTPSTIARTQEIGTQEQRSTGVGKAWQDTAALFAAHYTVSSGLSQCRKSVMALAADAYAVPHSRMRYLCFPLGHRLCYKRCANAVCQSIPAKELNNE